MRSGRCFCLGRPFIYDGRSSSFGQALILSLAWQPAAGEASARPGGRAHLDIGCGTPWLQPGLPLHVRKATASTERRDSAVSRSRHPPEAQNNAALVDTYYFLEDGRRPRAGPPVRRQHRCSACASIACTSVHCERRAMRAGVAKLYMGGHELEPQCKSSQRVHRPLGGFVSEIVLPMRAASARTPSGPPSSSRCGTNLSRECPPLEYWPHPHSET